jgi:anti-anti-sigma factor
VPPTFDISALRDERGQLTLVLAGELDMATAGELGARLQEAAETREHVVIDLSELAFMDSSGLRLLLQAAMDSRRDGWQLSIRRPAPGVRRVMEVSGAAPLLPLVEE